MFSEFPSFGNWRAHIWECNIREKPGVVQSSLHVSAFLNYAPSQRRTKRMYSKWARSWSSIVFRVSKFGLAVKAKSYFVKFPSFFLSQGEGVSKLSNIAGFWRKCHSKLKMECWFVSIYNEDTLRLVHLFTFDIFVSERKFVLKTNYVYQVS